MLKIFLFLFILSVAEKLDAAKCITGPDDWCVFSKISTTELFTQFHPSADYVSNVEKVKFQSSRLHTLTNKLCQEFPNLEELDLSSVMLRRINEDAFEDCAKLRSINLSSNHLTEISGKLFKNNKNLESIDLKKNYLKEIDLELLSELTKLTMFDASRNRLQSFFVSKSSVLPALRDLYLQNNELTEISEQSLVQKFPNLEKLGMAGNFLSCKRVEEMEKLFEEYEILKVEAEYGRSECISEEQWIRLPCEKRLAGIREEWMWMKSQMYKDDEDDEE